MPDIRFSTDLLNRYQFGHFCQRRGLLGSAMELGVHRGEFAGHFLAGWAGEKYYAVDHYLPYRDINQYPYRDNWKPRDVDRQIAHVTLARFGDRIVWRELDVLHALQEHAEASLDFVYIDAGHIYWEVMQEIGAAWPRLRPGGILAGHDYFPGTPDVIRAVKELSDREGVTVWITQDDWIPWSWYCFKPGA